MRNPKRIKFILRKLEKIWKRYPDLRLGQLLLNSLSEDEDLYYMEDEDLLRKVMFVYLYGGYGDRIGASFLTNLFEFDKRDEKPDHKPKEKKNGENKEQRIPKS